jgi:hypothetical protein
MKISESKDHNLESSGIKKEEKFDIGDVGFVLTLLRGQLYSNIIRTITQEYMSNARDAHREANCPDKQIMVSLPHVYDLHWKCRDYGPGISPERMTNVFIQYGNSTKRGSNVETGGFGLGAKSAFGYSDSFIINTFIDKVKRSYCAIIDETERGILQLMSEQPTTEENGTEIIVPVKQKDLAQFSQETVSVTRHWKNKPILKNLHPSFSYKQVETKPIISGTRWFVEAHNRKALYAVLDEIEYAIPDTMVNYDTVKIGNSKLFMEFKTGELEVAPNRETLKQSDSNKKKIAAIIKTFEDEIKSNLQKDIDKQPSFAAAILNFDTIRNKLNVHLDKDLFSWNGSQLIDQYVKISHLNGYCCYYGTDGLYKYSKGNEGGFKINPNTIYVETQKEFNKTVEKALGVMVEKLNVDKNKFPKICLINTKSVPPDKKDEFHLKKLGSYVLEDYYKFLDAKERKQALTKTLFFKLDSSIYYSEDNCDWVGFSEPNKTFGRSSLAVFDEDKTKKAFVFLDEEKHPQIENREEFYYGTTELEVLKAISGYSIYGFKLNQVDRKKIEELMADEGVIHVETLFREEFKKHTLKEWNNIVMTYIAAKSSYYGDKVSSMKLLPEFLSSSYSYNMSRAKIDFLVNEEIQNLYLKDSPSFVHEYFKKLFELKLKETEFAKKARLPHVLKKENVTKELDKKNDEFMKPITEVTDLKSKFDEYYNVSNVINTYNNHRSLPEFFEMILFIDHLKKNGYTAPKRPKILEKI